jgi:retron-type reverse transcriptase
MGGERVLWIPMIRHRVTQQAAELVLEPIFENFEPNAYG